MNPDADHVDSLDDRGMEAAVQQTRLALMVGGGLTLAQIDRSAPGVARSIISAYLAGVEASRIS